MTRGMPEILNAAAYQFVPPVPADTARGSVPVFAAALAAAAAVAAVLIGRAGRKRNH